MLKEELFLRRAVIIGGALHARFHLGEAVKPKVLRREDTSVPSTKVIASAWPFGRAANDSSVCDKN